MMMAEVQKNNPQRTSPFQAIGCVMSVNNPLARESHITELSDKYFSRSPHSQWEGITKLTKKHVDIERGEEWVPPLQPITLALGERKIKDFCE